LWPNVPIMEVFFSRLIWIRLHPAVEAKLPKQLSEEAYIYVSYLHVDGVL